MSDDSPLWASIARAASEAGRLAQNAVEELSGAFIGKEQRRARWPVPSRLLAGPVIPAPYIRPPGHRFVWQDAYMASCAVSVAKALTTHDTPPATICTAVLMVGLHMRPAGYRQNQVAMNSHRVLHHREWRRLGSSILLHADLPHLVNNCTGLVLEGAPLEARLGTPRFLCLLASLGLTSQALYLAVTRLAADCLPNSSLAGSYFNTFTVGFSGVVMALKVMAGYMREADLAASRVEPSEEFVLTGGRLAAWPSLMMSQFLVPGASLVGHLCGLAAGVLHVYAGAFMGRLRRRRRGSGGGGRRLRDGRLVPALGPQDLGTGRHPGLGWLDAGSHVVLGVAACLAARYGGIAQAKR